jgi:hypothetical protein
MATNKLSINVATSDTQTFVTSSTRHKVAIDLRNLFNGLAGGVRTGPTVVSAQEGLVQASATITCASAVTTGDTVTINGVAITGAVRRATDTVTVTTVLATQTVTVNGLVFTAVDSAPTAVQFLSKAGGTDDTGCAASLAAQINASTNPLILGVVTATSASNVVTIRAVDVGTAANSIAVSASAGTAVVATATLAGGLAHVNNTWDTSPGSTFAQAAADIVRCINASTTAALSSIVVASSPGTAVVTVTAGPQVPGIAGNMVTLVSSNGTRLAVTGSGKLASGANGTIVSYNY